MNHRLTNGALEVILTGGSIDAPTVQLLSYKCMPSQGAPDRYRLLLSDGVHSFSYAMLATQSNQMITSGRLTNLSVIKLDNYVCNVVNAERRVIVVLDCTILSPGCDVNTKIGDPTPYKVDASNIAANDSTNQSNQSSITTNNPSVSSSNRPNPPGVTGGRQGPPAPYSNKPSAAPVVNKVNTIDSLTPYQNRWRIRARVTGKSAIRTWSNSRGEGRLFSFNLIDASSEIRATAFNEAVDKYHDMIEINKVYYISKATLKTANKQYTNIQNDYEMTLNSDTIIEPCNDEVDLPGLSFKFVKINEMDNHEANSIVDLLGVVKSCGDVTSVIGRQSQKEISKRDITLVDQSGMSISVTLWGIEAVNFNGQNNPVMCVKGAKLSDYGGRSLSVLGSSQVLLNPDMREAHMLRSWYDREGQGQEFGSYRNEGMGGGFATNWKTFSQVKSEGLGSGDKPDYFSTKATATFLKKDNCMYMACPTDSCNKKLIDQGNGMYRCEKCQREFPNYKWRMILNVCLSDFSDNQWATFFQESAEAILGKGADELGNLRETNEAAFDQVFQEATFKSFVCKLRIKMETFNDESRMKAVCMSATPVDFVSYGNKLVEDITRLLS